MKTSIENINTGGFTLAEVLITLGIIGVIAAITLPSIILEKQRKELEAGLQKSYSSIQQALQLYQADTGTPLLTSDVQHNGVNFKKILMKYMKYAKDCGYGYSDKNTACIPNNPDSKDTKIYKNFNGSNYINMECFDDGQFVLNDESLVIVNTIGACPVNISVDVNGFNKGPNRLGQDLFIFLFNGNDGKLYPGGINNGIGWDNMPCNKTSTSWSNGGGCTVKALTDPDFFKDLP